MNTFLSKKSKLLFLLCPLVLLIAVASLCGLLVKDIYAKETQDWLLQALAQDYFDLFILVPVIAISTFFTFKNSRFGLFLLLGSLIYTVYSYIIYCFAVHFNIMFLVYCSVLGLSVYSIIYLFVNLDFTVIKKFEFNNKALKFAGTLLLIYGILFYLMWMTEIISEINSAGIPDKIKEIGGVTNPVHVLDLALVLPGFIISSILIFRKNHLGYLFVPSFLAFSSMMSLTISFIMIYTNIRHQTSEFNMAVIFIISSLISLFGFIFMKEKSLIPESKKQTKKQ